MVLAYLIQYFTVCCLAEIMELISFVTDGLS